MSRLRRSRTGYLDGMVERTATDLALHTGSKGLVYLIHGVTGTPVEMHYLAKRLAREGWDVYVPTLPGHCTRLRDLVRTTELDWRVHVQRQLKYARAQYDTVHVAGLSAGALLALEASTVVKLDGIGVLSPTFAFDGWNAPWSHALLPAAMKLVPLSLQHLLFHIDGPPYGIKDPVLRARVGTAYHPATIVRAWWKARTARRKAKDDGPCIPSAASNGYPIFPLRTLTEIHRLIQHVSSRLAQVTAPTIVIQAAEDDMTGPRNAALVHDGIASTDKEVVLLDDCYHVITVDQQKHEVVRHLHRFFTAHRICHHMALKSQAPWPPESIRSVNESAVSE